MYKSREGSQSTQLSEGTEADTDKTDLRYKEVNAVIELYMEVVEGGREDQN